MKKEHIVAVFADKLNESFNGLAVNNITSDMIVIAQRELLESNEQFRQIIPYAINVVGNKIFTYRRTSKGGENKLHDKYSIGVGGHIDLPDVLVNDEQEISVSDTCYNSLARELDEELDRGQATLESYQTLEKLIVLSDTPVDRVHVGLVVVNFWSHDTLKSNEDCLDFVGMKTIDELEQMEGLEPWSKAILPLVNIEIKEEQERKLKNFKAGKGFDQTKESSSIILP